MTHKESVKWLDSLINAIGKSQHQELWIYAQALDEIKEMLENEASKPLCKIGDTVYQIDSVRIYESKIKRIIYDTDNIAFDEEAIGQSVFLSKSEAEERLNTLEKSHTCENECTGCCHNTDCGYFNDLIRLGEEKAFKVCRYVGLNDKNGKKIFEGDIVQYTYLDEYILQAVVKFGEYEQDGSGGEYPPTKCIGFYAEVINAGCLPDCFDYKKTENIFQVASECEVIGNICDNPELLKESCDE